MNERLFVDQRREAWHELRRLVDRANARHGLASLEREELLRFGPLYRQVSADLAHARAFADSSDLVQQLNDLVGRAHAALYEAETTKRPLQTMAQFYLVEFPALLQRRWRYFAAALIVTVLGGIYAYWLVTTRPEALDAFIPAQLRSSADAWKAGKVETGPHAEMSSFLMTHNFQMGMLTFATGLAGGVPTADFLFQNGAMLGGMAALMTQVHRHNTFWPGIVPHGIAELTAIFVCGAGGFLIGVAVIAPGRRSRRAALREAGGEAIRLVLGSIPLFIFAGVIEGMFSHLPLRPGIRYAFAVFNGIVWYLYLFLPRHENTARPEMAGTSLSSSA
jgi:uncharacterized membrane protein SpoIIM required for sporulation